MRRSFIGVACLFGFLLFAGCGSMQSAEQPLNMFCPMNPDEAVGADSPTVEFDGEDVAFCCKKCAKKFDGMSSEKKAGAIESAMAKR